MWNQFRTDQYHGVIAEMVGYKGARGDRVAAYYARPLGQGPFPAVVLAPHIFGLDEFHLETARRFAQHGYLCIAPNLLSRFGDGTIDDVFARARGAGGMVDDDVVGDLTAARDHVRSQLDSNGKVGVIGMCSGGRHAYLTACREPGFDAVVDCWGGRVIMAPEALNAAAPVAPIDYTKDLSCPVLGLFGNDDQSPPPAQVDEHEALLKQLGKQYEFHRYDGAGHGFFYYDRAMYRQEQAMDGWAKVFDFFGRHLQAGASSTER